MIKFGQVLVNLAKLRYFKAGAIASAIVVASGSVGGYYVHHNIQQKAFYASQIANEKQVKEAKIKQKVAKAKEQAKQQVKLKAEQAQKLAQEQAAKVAQAQVVAQQQATAQAVAQQAQTKVAPATSNTKQNTQSGSSKSSGSSAGSSQGYASNQQSSSGRSSGGQSSRTTPSAPAPTQQAQPQSGGAPLVDTTGHTGDYHAVTQADQDQANQQVAIWAAAHNK